MVRTMKGAFAIAATVCALSAALVAPNAAYAASSTWPIPTSPMDNTVVSEDGTVKEVITAAANGCYRSIPEIVGLNNTLQNPDSTASKASTAAEALTAMMENNDYGLFGSPANEYADAYMWNYYYNFYAKVVGAEEAPEDVTCTTCNASAAGFDTTAVAAYGGINTAFYHRPDIAYGIGTVNEDGSSTYSAYVDLINTFTEDQEWYQEGDETYDPYLIDCRGDYGQKFFHIQTIYDLADAAQSVIEDSDSTKTTRYGDDPYEYAVEFEKYARASQYSVLQAIDEGTVEKKTIAYVTAVDSSTQVISALPTDVSSTSFEDMYQDLIGSTCIRYMYAPNITENLTYNVGDVNNCSKTDAGYYALTAEDIMACDKVTVQTGSGMSNTTNESSVEDIKTILRSAGYTDESEWPEFFCDFPSYPGGGGGNYAWCSFYGAILGFVYPEVFSPVDLEAYYCEIAYHVASTYLADAMNIVAGEMSLPEGVELDLSNYSHQSISNQIDEGIAYYLANLEEIDAAYPNLVASEHLLSYASENGIVAAGSSSSSDSTLTNGLKVTVGSGSTKATYTIKSVSKRTVTYTAYKGKKTTATVPKTVKIKGNTYTVVGISAKAFKGTKAKTVKVKATKLTKKSVKNALKGSKVTKVKVPKAKLSAYKKYFAKANSGKKVTVK